MFSKKKAYSIQIKALSLYPIIRALWLTIVIKTLPLCYKNNRTQARTKKTLQDCYESSKPEFVAVYGRRRIGKTFLVKQFFKEKFDFYFTGAYQATKKDQLFNFKMTLESYSGVKRKTPYL